MTIGYPVKNYTTLSMTTSTFFFDISNEGQIKTTLPNTQQRNGPVSVLSLIT